MKLKTLLHFILLSSFWPCLAMDPIFPVSKLPRDLQIQIFSEFLTMDPAKTIIENLKDILLLVMKFEKSSKPELNPFQEKLLHERISYLIKKNYSRKHINRIFVLLPRLNLKKKEIVQIFLNAGAKINARNNLGSTSLMWASEMGNVELVEILIDLGANVNSRNKFGNTALNWASWLNNLNTAKKLIKAGAYCNVQNRYGDTALMTASWKGYVEFARLLIDAGANIHMQNSRCYDAMAFAKEHGQKKIMKLLKKKMKEGKAKKRCSVM